MCIEITLVNRNNRPLTKTVISVTNKENELALTCAKTGTATKVRFKLFDAVDYADIQPTDIQKEQIVFISPSGPGGTWVELSKAL